MAAIAEALMPPSPDHGDPPRLRKGAELPEIIVLFIAPGSQFCVKAAAYLLQKRVPFRYQKVDNKELAPPALVPVLRWGDQLVPDSQRILDFVDQFLETENAAYPDDEVRDLDDFVGREINEHVQYMSFIDEDGFDRSMKLEVEKATPSCLRLLCPCCCNGRSVLKLSGYQKQIYERIARHLPAETLEGGDGSVRRSLRGHLKDLDARMGPNEYLLGTPGPSGCDFALYGMLDRLIGDSGCGMGAAFPNVLQEARCERLQDLYERMKRACPVDFLDKGRNVAIDADESFLPPVDEQLAMRVRTEDIRDPDANDADDATADAASVL